MGQTERFYTPPLDRTPYQSCFLVAFLAVVIFLIGSAALWSLAGLVKHQRFLEFPIGSFTDLGNQVRQATEQKANQAVHQAADTAQQQIKQAANQQITQQENQLKAQATQQIKQQAEQLAPTLIPAQK